MTFFAGQKLKRLEGLSFVFRYNRRMKILDLLFGKHRHLIAQMTRQELQARYASSFLGFFWALLIPLSTLLIYTFVFSVVLRSAWENTDLPYAFILFAALIPFTFITDVLNRAPTLVLAHPNYVKKVVFPLHILPVVACATALVDSVLSLLLLFVGLWWKTGGVSPWALLLPLVYLPLLLITLGAGWFLASLGVYIRDIAPLVGIVTRLWFFVTPIVFPIERIPETYRWMFALNPLTSIVGMFRNLLLFGQPLAWTEWLTWTVFGLLLALAGYFWFVKTSRGFADVL